MTFKSLLQQIESSKVFKSFKEKYPDSELCVGFFIIDFLSNDNKQTLDYKTNSKIFTFELKGEDIIMVEDKLIETPEKPPLLKIDSEIKIEVEELKGIVGVQALEHGISAKFNKIIAILQKYESEETNNKEKQIWNLTCMLEGLIILHILIDSQTGDVLKFERKSMMDLIKKK